MTDAAAERVLVLPTAAFYAAGVFHGFCPRVADYLPRLLEPSLLSFRPRAEVETDPSYKQIIPYVVLRSGNLVFHYTRGQKGSEARLRALPFATRCRACQESAEQSEARQRRSGDRAFRSRTLTEVIGL